MAAPLKRSITFSTLPHQGEAPQHCVIENQTNVDEDWIYERAREWFGDPNHAPSTNFITETLASRPLAHYHVLKVIAIKNGLFKLEMCSREPTPSRWSITSDLPMLDSIMEEVASHLDLACAGANVTSITRDLGSSALPRSRMQAPTVSVAGRVAPIITTGIRGPSAIRLCIKFWYRALNGSESHLKPFGAYGYSCVFNGNRTGTTLFNDVECLITEIRRMGAKEFEIQPLEEECYMLEIRHGGRLGVQMRRHDHLFELRGRSREKFVTLYVTISHFSRSAGRRRATGGTETDTAYSWHPVGPDSQLRAQWNARSAFNL